MALELDWRTCEENKYAEAFGFYMMFTEIGWELTDKNIQDFYVRCKFHEKFFGAMYHTPDGPLDITPTTVKKYVGLKANVSPKTFNQFALRMVSVARQDYQADYKKETRDVQEV